MKLTDFLGHEYGPGDLVIYAAMSGRCANMIFGRVVEIHRVWHNSYTVGERYGWERLEDDAPVPRKTNYQGEDIGECDSGFRVRVQPLRGARWEQHHAKDYYVDSRSGKRIDPYRSAKYVLKPAHYVFADGIEYDYAAEQAAYDARPYRQYSFDHVFRGRFQIWHSDVPGQDGTGKYVGDHSDGRPNLWYVSRQWQPWVEKRTEPGPKPVTLTVTDNIVKWEGELPDGEV